MQKHQTSIPKHLNDCLLTSFKTYSQNVKQIASKSIYENHNKLMNKILLLTQKDANNLISQVLAHLLTLAQVKNSKDLVIPMLTKFIQFFKYYERVTNPLKLSSQQKPQYKQSQQQVKQQVLNPNQSTSQSILNSLFLSSILDILHLILTKCSAKQPQTYLRLIQTTFSLIDVNLVQYMDYSLFTKIYSISFDCYVVGGLVLRNISVSCLFSFTQIIIQHMCRQHQLQQINHNQHQSQSNHTNQQLQQNNHHQLLTNNQISLNDQLQVNNYNQQSNQRNQAHNQDQLIIMENFINYLFANRKFLWIKDNELNGIVWDLVVVAIKHMDQLSLHKLLQKQANLQLINLMYKISAQKCFNPKPVAKVSKKETSTSKWQQISQFLRCYKAFITLSIKLSLISLQSNNRQIVPFLDNIKLFKIIYDLQRNHKMYIFLQGIFMLIDTYPELFINQERTYFLLQIVTKVSQELCLCLKTIDTTNKIQKSFINQHYTHDVTNINDADFVKIIKNFIIQLRKKLEYLKNKEPSIISNNNNTNKSSKDTSNNGIWRQSQMKNGLQSSMMSSQRSSHQQNRGGQVLLHPRKRWQKFMRCIIRIIRYLSSIPILSQSDQQPVRKILLQLQHWFLVLILNNLRYHHINQYLLITTSNLKSSPQAVKVSQCIQIASNLIYGYYDLLDSLALTILMKMMAGIRAQRQQGKQYQQMEQVFNMSQKLYLQQKIVKNNHQFQITIQAFVQCANSLLADLEQPVDPNKKTVLGKNPSQRYYKMIQYLLQKLNIVILQNQQFLFNEWNFLTGFWMSFCSNKHDEIQLKTISHVGQIIQKLLAIHPSHQQQIISIYLQLSAKCTLKKQFLLEYQIISQIKDFIPLVDDEIALMETFKIIKILQTQITQKTNNNLLHQRKFINQLSQLQECFIKEGVHKIMKLSYLQNVLLGIQVLGKQKNQQYKIFTLLWNIADHLRTLHPSLNQSKSISYVSLWKQLFTRICLISQTSVNAETKQSSMHTFTQIIAQNSFLLQKSLLLQLYQNLFVQKLFICLMECRNCGTDDINCKVDMIKNAGKNFLKLTKKFINENVFNNTKDNNQNVFNNTKYTIDKAFILIHQYLLNLNHNQSILPIQILYQLVVFMQKVITPEDIQTKFINGDFVSKIMIQLSKIGQRSDQNTIIWKKKYLPYYQKVNILMQNIFQLKKVGQIIELKQQKIVQQSIELKQQKIVEQNIELKQQKIVEQNIELKQPKIVQKNQTQVKEQQKSNDQNKDENQTIQKQTTQSVTQA